MGKKASFKKEVRIEPVFKEWKLYGWMETLPFSVTSPLELSSLDLPVMTVSSLYGRVRIAGTSQGTEEGWQGRCWISCISQAFGQQSDLLTVYRSYSSKEGGEEDV